VASGQVREGDADMWKILRTAVSLLAGLGGFLLLLPWRALDWIGRIMTAFDAQEGFNHLIDWLAAHPRLAFDFGPWLLILVSLISLSAIHGLFLWRLIRQRKVAEVEQSPQLDAVAASSPVSRSLGNLTNAQLRERTIDVARGLRELQHRYGYERNRIDLENLEKFARYQTRNRQKHLNAELSAREN
jgi:hypothetical protein